MLDFLKGALSVGLAEVFAPLPLVMVVAGILAIVGHSCSLFLHSEGGKGVATGLGVIAMLWRGASLTSSCLPVIGRSRDVSLGSCIAAALVLVLAYAWGYPVPYTAFGVLAAAFIIIRHKSNIVRLMNGTENKIHAGHRD